ncbi:MAG: fatty acid CoA ligase family protein [Victivallaceae bacterium]
MAVSCRPERISRMDKFNISQLLTEAAGTYGSRTALYAPAGKNKSGNYRYDTLSFEELENLTNAYAAAFRNKGFKKGLRVLMMVKPGLEFAATVFAVYKTGAVPVLIDPGMGIKNLLGCIQQTKPEAVVAISKAHWARKLYKKYFPAAKIFFSLGKFPPADCIRMETIATPAMIKNSGRKFTFATEDTTIDDDAVIVFTTGSTGPPKGVIYKHRTFQKQVEIIKNVYHAGPERVDMSAFPLFALFAVVLGMPSVIPEMDFTRPACVNPENIIKAVLANNVSFSFGSPALWRTVAAYCIEHKIQLPSLKTVLMAGAPVTAELHQMVKQIIASDGETMVPYGATEALPAANFTGSEMLSETAGLTAQGKGYCVGYANPGIEIKIIKCLDQEISEWQPEWELPAEQIGEIVVKGAIVKAGYLNLPQPTAMSEINSADGGKWHRMGDMGYCDAKGRIWFCGRKNHRVITPERIYYSVCSEAIFNQHPNVFRTALVDDGSGRPVLFIEPLPGKWPQGKTAENKLIAELKKLGAAYPFTAEINKLILRQSMPVDIRHNAKIFREKLAVAAGKIFTD